MGRAPRRISRCVVVALITATAIASGASAIDDEELPYGQAEQTSSDEQEAAASNPDETPAQADGMGGPSSVGAQLVRDGRHRKYEQLQKPKEWLQENYALSIGADYNLLAQQVSEGPGPTDGVGGVLRFYGSWALVNRGAAEDTGSFVFKVEYRHSLGTELPAASVLPTAGAAGISGPTFGDNGGVLTNLYWTQSFADNRFAFEVGVVDTTDYLDVYGLVNPWADFNNLAFSTSPAIAVPNQGLGAAALFMVTPRWYVLGGLADADADPHRPQDFFSSFAEGEYFTHVEFGRVGSWDTRYSDNIHLLLWRVDDRVEAGVDGGWGATVSWGFEYGGRWLPFVRGGWSDGGGTVVDRTASAGVGYRINQHDDYFGFAANWGRAPDNPRNQYQLEAYYRTHISPGLSVAPSAQVVLHPADNPEISSLWLIAVRLRAVW